MSDFMSPEDELTEIDEEECRECGKPTTTSDYIGPICKECHDQDSQ